MDPEQLVAIHKNHAGEIISFQTSSGRIISYRKALNEAEAGTITGVNINETDEGSASLVSADGLELNQFPDIY
ncbi:DUF3892 domain-containing protein [Heyndrickxia sp. MSNUG]|uniref:DUF3892 domain-containing protein n=1 Tax=Heyndrickxia sp. MSNUG TaxID=3136677 RepID=UPI003C2FB799